eukprot:GFKZ01007626.1.p1 GENE.GFKZ01007626.1~~GFKZ01007626.1.p1  ORF type:complete len:264 (+),score=26.58 GFKZ01007626.1:76-867(+)
MPTLAFLPQGYVPAGVSGGVLPGRRITGLPRTRYHSCSNLRKPRASAQPEESSTCPSSAEFENVGNEASQAAKPLLSSDQLRFALQDTMLSNEQLARVFAATRDGFSNDAFFDKQLSLGGVPSLVLGQTEAGVLFGGYSSYGFYARDDYREATSPRSMFVFTVDKDQVIFAENTDPVHYDFYDYAVRFGASLLGIPMNPDKHILKRDMATSSCRLPNGQTSVLGGATLAKLREVEVWVAKKYALQDKPLEKQAVGGFFSRLFG